MKHADLMHGLRGRWSSVIYHRHLVIAHGQQSLSFGQLRLVLLYWSLSLAESITDLCQSVIGLEPIMIGYYQLTIIPGLDLPLSVINHRLSVIGSLLYGKRGRFRR